MDLFKALKAPNALAVIPASTNAITARVTGLDRWGLGLSGFNLEIAPAENNKLLELGYLDNSLVHTVVDRKGQLFAQAKPVVYEEKDQKSFRKYKSLELYQKLDSYALRAKAIEEVDDAGDDLVRLLKRPNNFQSWNELAYALSVYWDFGNALLYGVKLDAGKNAGQYRELHLLPTSIYAGKNPGTDGYQSYYDAAGSADEVPANQVLHLRRFNPNVRGDYSGLWGISKLAAGRRLLTKSTASQEAEAEAMQNRGARTVIFPKGYTYSDLQGLNEMGASATEAIRKKLKQAGSGGVAGNTFELGSIELGLSPVDLNILKSNELTERQLCALWAMDPNTVFPSVTTGSLGGNKQEESNKASIRAGVLPDLYTFYAKLSDFLVPAFQKEGKPVRYIEPNTDVYHELQTNKSEQLDWMIKMGSSINERREAMGFERDPDPIADIKLVAQGQSPITDFAAGSNEPDPENEGTY